MRKTILLIAALLPLTACGPLIIGAGAAIVADQVMEDQNGGDGLF